MTTIPASQYRKMVAKKGNGKNKKIMGAPGIKNRIHKHNMVFDSSLELYFYEKLRLNKVEFIWKPQFVLLEAFKYRGETIKGIRMRPDAYFEQWNLVVDPKGHANETWPLKEKLLKRMLKSTGKEPEIRTLKTKKDIDQFILECIGWMSKEKHGND